jgi:NAD(P)-dependent dehydrogenase (short-subunit alcohol dehydrogenase family)
MMKRVLITGANRGIGLELTTQYAARGDRVFAACRIPNRAYQLEHLVTQYPDQVTMIPIDVTVQELISNAASTIVDQVQSLDILINNAAINLGDETLSEVRPNDLLKTLHVNAVSPVMVAQYFRDLLVKGDRPVIVNISSESGSISKMTRFRGYGYYGSKAAENMYTRSLAYDPETEGIIVIAMHPGWVRTDMGGSNAHLSPAESVAGILEVIDGLSPGDNGKFFTWEGHEYPW